LGVEPMEQKLRLGRVVALAVFFAALALSGWSLFGKHSSFVLFAFLAQLSLCFFIGTESFGPIAALRSRASRVLARVFCGPTPKNRYRYQTIRSIAGPPVN